VGQLLGKPKWEKPLADRIMATGVGFLGPENHDPEAKRVERNDGWQREPFTSMLYSVFVLSRLFFSYLQFRYMFACVFVYIAIMADGRQTRLNK
jgi:hypothetical protein